MANGYGRSSEGFGISRQQSVALIVRTAIDNGVTDTRHIAYMLATAQHETRNFTAPDEDFGRQQARKLGYRGGEEYFGRGYVHLTHIENYQKFDKLLGLNGQLLKNPELAKEPEIAAKILVIGMRDGLFTGKPLSRYINDDVYDTRNARRVVNGVNPKQPWSAKAARDCMAYTQHWEKHLTPERMARFRADAPVLDVVAKADLTGKALQTALNALGYNGSDGKDLTVDGVAGKQTEYAVRSFQRDHGLAVDGKVGPLTQAALTAVMAVTARQPRGQEQGQGVRLNSSSAAVGTKAVSSDSLDALKDLGIKIAAILPGKISGHLVNNLTMHCAARCGKEGVPLNRVGDVSLLQTESGKNMVCMVSKDGNHLVTANAQQGMHVPAEQSAAELSQQQQTALQQNLQQQVEQTRTASLVMG